MLAATMMLGGKMRRLETRNDGLWYLAWYKESDQEKFIKPKSTMCYS